MKNTDLVQLLHTFNRSDRYQAGLWLDSPLHNQREDLRRLYHLLITALQKGAEVPDRKVCFRALYPEEEYDDQRLRLASSRLLKCLERWLSWRQWQKEEMVHDNYLLAALRERNLAKAFRRIQRRQQKVLDNAPLRNHDFHHARLRLAREIYQWESQRERGKPLNLQRQEVALQTLFLIQKLRLACLTVAHSRVTNTQYQLALLPEVLALAAEAPYADEAAVQLYRFVYEMYQDEGSTVRFQQFGDLLYRHLHQFPGEERRDLLLLGINYCIRQINSQGVSFLREAFGLYQRGLEEGLLLEDGYLSNFTYTNIAILSIRLEELDWGERFIHEYQRVLAPDSRDSLFALNAARLAYARRDFRSALLYLHQFDDRDFIHQLSAKIIQLKVYYESGDYQVLAAHIRNTQAFLRRSKGTGYHKEIYVNIFRLTDQLLKLPPYDKERRKALRQQILDTQPLTEREWLLKQLDK